jgi:hypothetical protein
LDFSLIGSAATRPPVPLVFDEFVRQTEFWFTAYYCEQSSGGKKKQEVKDGINEGHFILQRRPTLQYILPLELGI